MGFLPHQMVVQKVGFLFPGQGAQYVGMGKDGAQQFAKAKNIFEEADRLLGYSLSRFCFEGPEDTLTRTLYAQPAIFVTSLALLSILKERRPDLKPDFVAGLSLGEFSALAASGSLSFSEGLRLVHIRAEAMEKAASRSDGVMISILGLSHDDCIKLAKESGAEIANLNAPDQFVLSGKKNLLEEAAELAEGMGAKRVIHLKVGGAFHSSLMEPAKAQFSDALRKIKLHSPCCLFASNVSAKGESDPERILILLAEQLTHPVRWIETMIYAREHGIRRFIEIGPGRVLKGLVKKIDPTLEVMNLGKVSDFETLDTSLEKV